jgi:hypothetical protein
LSKQAYRFAAGRFGRSFPSVRRRSPEAFQKLENDIIFIFDLNSSADFV